MKNIFTIFSLLVFILFLSLRTEAQNNLESIKAQAYLTQKGEVYFTFNIISKDEVFTLTRVISIDNVKGNQVFAYANKNEFDLFLNLGYTYTVLPHPGDITEGIEMHSSDKGIWQFDTYPTYTEYETMMATFAANYPDICQLVQIGTTSGGRKLLVLKITDNVNQSEAEPQFLYTSTMHGDETTGYILLLRLINHLLTNYGTNTEATALVNNLEIWINPLANPDGTYKGGNSSVSGATRSNGNNIDLNRNYLNPTSLHPDGNAYEQETIDFMAFSDTMNFVMSANFHGGAEVMNYPFDTYTSSQKIHADDSWCQFVSHEFADTVHLHGPTIMTDVSADGITNGGDWYVVYGSRQDYMCFYEQCREITIELSGTKLLPSNQLNTYWNYYYRSLINFMKQGAYGIRGTITDACGGTPVEAKIFVNNHDRDSSYIYSGARHGDYYRPIITGTYSVTFSANGYVSKTFDVTATNQQFITQDVQLVPVSVGADFITDVTSTCTGSVNFTCLTATASAWLWNFGDGTYSSLQNPSHVYTQDGNYTVMLTVTNSCSNQIIKSNLISVTLVTPPVTVSASRCGSGSVDLVALGSGIMNWYDASSDGNLLAINDTLITPYITQTTTYYVENTGSHPSEYIGIVSSTTSGQMYNQPNIAWLSFNCVSTFNLVSVEVNAAVAGNREIYVLNSAGTKIDSVIKYIPLGVSRVNLNIIVPVGTGYKLVGTANANLYRSSITSGSFYPFDLAGLVTITGAGIPSSPNLPTKYYYFYNWEVKEVGCVSERIPATAVISDSPLGGITQAVLSEICSGNSTSVSLNGNTGTSIQWQQSPDGTNFWTNVSGGSGATTPTFTTPSLTSTTFYRALVSEFGCNDSYSTVSQVTVNSQPIINTVQTNITCYGAADGTATANVTGGQTPYTYNWSNGDTTANSQELTVNIYSLTVTDAAMCSATSFVTISEPLQINIYATVTDATCGNSNGSATASATGGTGTIDFHWSNNVNAPTIQNVLADNYSVTATDGNGCSVVSNVIIGNQAQFVASVSSTEIQCYGDTSSTATADVTGGALPISFLWSTDATTNVISGLGAGTITVTITDNNNCSTILSETISQPEAIAATINATSSTCELNNGLIEAVASGGTGILTYLWSNDSLTASQSNLAPGLYNVTIMDSNGCSMIYQGLVNEIPSVTGSISIQNVACYGGTNGSAIVVASSGTPPYSYSWSTGSLLDNASNLQTGTVSVTITDNTGCLAVITNSVSQPQQITVDLVITPESLAGANDGAAFATVSGGTAPYNYSWSNGNHDDSITSMSAGNYSLGIIDANNCIFSIPVVIDVLNSISEINSDYLINIYPNPAKKYIEVRTSEKIIKIELISFSGQVLFMTELISERNVLNLSKFANGMYLIRLTNDSGSLIMRKFVIAE